MPFITKSLTERRNPGSCHRGSGIAPRAGLALIALMLAACSAARGRRPVPFDKLKQAHVLGFPAVRGFAFESSPALRASLLESGQLLVSSHRKTTEPLLLEVLALSGGGPNGAFSAGFLQGWTQSGRRPEFALVTGVSTGALIAPFAFLGPEYDHVLQSLYTTRSSGDLFRRLPFWRALTAGALFDSTRLERLIDTVIDERVLGAIAEEHESGRRLLVLTTNLDAGRAVVWDMGKIAVRRDASALGLFKRVLLASSSPPVMAPPVFIEVHVDETRYDEMHVDGGVASQVFFHGLLVDLHELRLTLGYRRDDLAVRAYILRNGVPHAEWSRVSAGLRSVASRSVAIATKAMALGDLLRIHELCQQSDLEFRLATSPADIDPRGVMDFDQSALSGLWEEGMAQGQSADPWLRHPFEMFAER